MSKKHISVRQSHQITAFCPKCLNEYEIDIESFEVKTTLNVSSNSDIKVVATVECPHCKENDLHTQCLMIDREFAPLLRAYYAIPTKYNQVSLYISEWTAGELYLSPVLISERTYPEQMAAIHTPAKIAFHTYRDLSYSNYSVHKIFERHLGLPDGWDIARSSSHLLCEHVFELVEKPIFSDGSTRIVDAGTILGVARKELVAKRAENLHNLEVWWNEKFIPALKSESLYRAIVANDDDDPFDIY